MTDIRLRRIVMMSCTGTITNPRLSEHSIDTVKSMVITMVQQDQIQIIAGTASSLIFIGGTLSMLLKTWKSRDVTSFSIASILLNNAGNLVYWLYVVSLPPGPVYVMHAFYTVAMMLMLIFCLLYRHRPAMRDRLNKGLRRITQTLEMPALREN